MDRVIGPLGVFELGAIPDDEAVPFVEEGRFIFSQGLRGGISLAIVDQNGHPFIGQTFEHHFGLSGIGTLDQDLVLLALPDGTHIKVKAMGFMAGLDEAQFILATLTQDQSLHVSPMDPKEVHYIPFNLGLDQEHLGIKGFRFR